MKQIFQTLIYKFLGAGLGFFTTLLSTWLFGATVRGYLTLTITNFLTYSPVIGAFSEYTPYGIHKRKQEIQAVFSVSLLFCYLLSFLVFFLSVAGYWKHITFFGMSEDKMRTIWFAGMIAPFAMLHVYITRLAWALHQLHWLNRLNIIQTVCFLPALLIGWLGASPESDVTLIAISIWGLSYLLASLYAAFVTHRHFRISLRPRFGSPSLRKDILSYGLQIVWARLLSVLNSRLDVFLVFWLLGAHHTGVYSIAVTAAEILLYLSGSILQVVMTRITSLEQTGSTDLTAQTFRNSAVLIFLTGIVVALMMTPLIFYFFPVEFRPAITILYILLPGIALLGLTDILQIYYTNQLGRPKLTIYLAAISIVVNLLSSYWLLPVFGEIGAAWAKSISFFSMFFFSVSYFCYVTKYSVFKLLVPQSKDFEAYRMYAAKILKSTFKPFAKFFS